MNNITPIIEAEATKLINEYIHKGSSKEEAIKLSLNKIKELRKRDPLVVIHWEIEKALIIKLAELK